jgi:hypothetical protein
MKWLLPFLIYSSLHAKVIAIQEIQSDHLSATARASLSNLVTAQLESELPGNQFLSWGDVKEQMSRLDWGLKGKNGTTKSFSQDSLMVCRDRLCLERLGTLLHIDQFLLIDLSRLDSSFVTNMRLVDVGRGAVESRSFRTYKGSVDRILPLLSGMYHDVVATPEQKRLKELEMRDAQRKPYRLGLRWISGGLLVAAGGFSIWQVGQTNEKIRAYNRMEFNNPELAQVKKSAENAILLQNLGLGTALVSAIGLGVSFTF